MTEEEIQIALKIWWRTVQDNFFLVSGKAILHLVPPPVVIAVSFRILAKDTPHLRRYRVRISKEEVIKYSQSRTTRKKTCSKRKDTETIKDMFLLNDSTIDTMPRRSERQFFYQRIIACVVKFTSDMLEDDIIQHMNKQFPYVGSLILFPKFSFLKPVDDSLIEPDIKCWDYSTVKHIAGQGPIHIRVHKKLKVKGDLIDDNSDLSRHLLVDMKEKKSGTTSNKTNRTIHFCFQKKTMVECPV